MSVTVPQDFDNLINLFENYQTSNSSLDLQKISDYIRISTSIENSTVLDFSKAYLQVNIEKYSKNDDNNDASKRFSLYDILVDLCKNFGLLEILTVEVLKIILSEINVYCELETATAVQVIFELCELENFEKVKDSSQEATKLLEELYLKMIKTIQEQYDGSVEINEEDKLYIQDDNFLISVTKLVTIFNPKLLLAVKNFESFSKNYLKIYLESIAFITKKAKFDHFKVNLTGNILNLIKENLASINQNDQFFALLAVEYISVHDFEQNGIKDRVYELLTFPDISVRLQCLKVFATRTKYLEGCKSAMRINGFLDWLLIKKSESEKELSQVKFDIVVHVESFARSELKLHSKIQLELKRYVKDGAFYDSKVGDVRVETEEA